MSTELIPFDSKPLTREQQLVHIYAEVACGRSLSAILEEDEGMPHRRTFWQWHLDDDAVRSNLARARENGVEALMDKAQTVAETPLTGEEVMMEVGPDGTKRRVTRKEMLGHRRLVIETYYKRAQMIAPRKYGPKLDLTTDGEKLSSVADAIAAGNKRLEALEKGQADV